MSLLQTVSGLLPGGSGTGSAPAPGSTVKDKILDGINDITSGIKLPTVHTDNKVSVDQKSIFMIGGLLLVVVLLFSGKKRKS